MTQPVQTSRIVLDPGGRGGSRRASNTVPHDFRLRVETAGAGRLHGNGFLAHRPRSRSGKKYSFVEMKRILDGNGITHIEVEWLLDWFCTDQRRVASDETRTLLLDAAEALGAHHIKIGDLGNDCANVAQMTDEFGPSCAARPPSAAQTCCSKCFRHNSRVLPASMMCWRSVMAQVPPTAESCWTTCTCSAPAHRRRTSSARSAVDIPLGVEINDGTLAMPVRSRGFRHQQAPAAGRRRIRHRRVPARGLDAGL